MKKALLFLLLTVLVTALPFIAISAIINVPGDQASIQAGLNTAASGDTVLVTPGTYYEHIVWPAVAGIKLHSSGDQTNTIIDGSGSGTVITLYNASIDINTTISGFTIQNGSASEGGGIHCQNCSVTLSDLKIQNNTASTGGGIAFMTSPNSAISDITLYNNLAYFQGGGINYYNSSGTLEGIHFLENTAVSMAGALLCQTSTINLTYVTFEGNVQQNTTLSAAGNDINMHSGASSITIANSNFETSTNSIIDQYGTSSLSFENNWWGSASGPVSSTLPAAATYSPFLTSPDPDAPLLPPSNVTTTRSASDEVVVSWDDFGLTDLDHSTVYYDTDSGAPYANSVNAGADTTCTISSLTLGETYYFSVKSFDGDGKESSYSGEVTFDAGYIVINVPADETTIQAGLNAAFEGDTVLVASGTYTENITWPNVNGIKLLSSDGPEATSIDGGNSGSVLLFNSASIDTNTVVSGFTLEGGTNDFGGGIKCINSSPKITDLFIESNFAINGGGIYCVGSSSIFKRLLIYGNEAGTNGGAVYLASSSPEFYNITMFDNTASSFGNGIYIANSFPIANLFLTQSNILNPVSAIQNDGAGTVDIPLNWWGTGGMPVAGALVGGIIVPSLLSSPDPDAPVPPVQGFTLERQTGYSVQLSWTDDGLSDFLTYIVYWDNDAPGAPYTNHMDQIGTSEWTVSNLTPGETYYFAVQICDEDNNRSLYSEEKSASMKYVHTVPGDYATIQSALDGVSELDTVSVAAGTYYENLAWPETDKVTLIGADTRTTIIDGSGSNPVLSITGVELEIELEVSQFTIQNGAGSNGGGIDIDGVAYPNLNNLFVVNNTGGFGAGIFIRYSFPTLSDIAIHGNTGSPYAGAIQNVSSYPTMNRITISDNTSDQCEGLYSASGDFSINNSNLAGDGTKIENANFSNTIDATNNWWGNTAGPQNGDAQGDGIYTSPYLSSPNTLAPVPPPSGFTVTRTSATSFDLTWDPVPIADFGWYTVYYDNDQSGAPYSHSVNILSTDTTTSITGLTLDETYYFVVSCTDEHENESWYSVEISAETGYILDIPAQFSTIQSAIDVAFAGDTLLVAPGTYTENLVWSNVDDITLLSSGTRENTIIYGDSSGSVIAVNNTGNNGEINGFTIQNGAADAGGGIYCMGRLITLKNLIIADNHANYYGGGLHFRLATGAPSTLENVEIVRNTCGNTGGGIYEENAEISATNVFIAENTAAYGAAIGSENSTLTLSNITVEKNTASASCNGILVNEDSGTHSVTISNSNIVNSGEKFVSTGLSSNTLTNNWWGNTEGPQAGDVTGSATTSSYLTTPAVDAPVITPGSVTAQRTSSNEVQVDWDNFGLTDLDHSTVYYGISPGAPYTDSVNAGTANTYTISGLTYGETYYFAVKCFDGDGNSSPYSDEVSAEVKRALPIPSEFTTIQAGLDIAANGDTVLVAPGTYTENITWPAVNGIVMTSSSDSSNTIIDGNASGSVITINSASIDTNTVISGFTITNGYNMSNSGGGINCPSGSPLLEYLHIEGNNVVGDIGGGIYVGGDYSDVINMVIRNVTIINNESSIGGGAYFNLHNESPETGVLTISNSVICQNSAEFNNGGGIFFYKGTVTLENVTIRENLGSYGSGVYCNESAVTINGGSVSLNTSSHDGGGIYGTASTLTLTDVAVDSNTAGTNTVDYGSGGGIFCDGISTLTITGGSVSNNTTTTHGGGIYCQDTTPTFDGVTVNNNEAGSEWEEPNGYGGGIWVGDCTTPAFSNMTVDGNVGVIAGGIGVYASTATLTDVNITNNNASFRCGGLLLFSATNTTFTGGSISNNHSDGHGGGIYNLGSPIELTDVTMGFNVADSSGGAIYGEGTTSANTIENCRIYRNEALNGSALYQAEGTTELTGVAVEGNITHTVGDPAIYLDSGTSFDMNQSSMVYNNNGAFVEADDLKGIFYDDSTGTSCTINLSNILNQYGALEANESSAVDARFNWWGEASGAGSLVTGTNVDTDDPLQVVLPNTPPVPPSNVSVASTTDESITISWDALPLTDLAGYKVYIWDAADYQPAGDHGNGLDIGNVTSHTCTGLTLGASYSMAVTAYDNDGNESWYSAYLAVGTYIPLVVPDNYATIQAALNAATAGDTVLVNPGTYVENISWPAVNGIKLFSTGDSSNTIIDGDLSGNVLTLNSGVLDTLTEISGFTLTNGLRGIYIKNCSAKFDHLHVCYNNSSTSSSYDERGVGVYADNSHSIFTNMDISHNEVKTDGRAPYYGFGSGLYAVYGNNVVRNTIIAYNKSRDGAGIYFDYGVLTLEHCVIYKNGGAAYGSGLWSSYKTSVLNMVDVKFVDNYATTSQGFCVIYHSNYWDNQAPWTFNNVTLYDSDSFPSSAIEMYGPAMDIENCYVEGGGPGIASDQDNMVINNCNLVSDWKVVCVYGDNWDLTDNWWGGVDGDLQQSMQILNWGSYNRHPHLTIPAPDAGIPVIKGLTAGNITGSSMVLSWDASLIPDLAGYKIYYDTRDIEQYYYTSSLDVGNTTSYTFDGLTPGESYYFTVVAYDTDGYESWYAAPVNPTMTTPLTRHVPADYTTIQEALNAAANGDSIVVAGGGSYSENITWPNKYGLKLIGDPNNKPVIEGDGTRWAFYMMVGSQEIDTNTVISGFEITGGGGDSYDGAGMSIVSASPILDNLDIHDNNGTRYGGGLLISNGSPILRNSTIRDNVGDFGGGIYISYSAEPLIENTTISNNTAETGGGLSIYQASVIQRDVVISGNTCTHNGGGVYAYQTHSSFTDVQVINNRSDIYAYGLGAGFYAVQDTSSLERVTIVGNIANYQGAGMHILDGNSMTITHCTVANNSSPDGGDIWVHGDALGELSYSNFVGSSVKVVAVNSAQVNAENNYWGDPSGPQAGDLAGIAGNLVSPYSAGVIDYESYLTEPDTLAPPIPATGLAVVDSTKDYIDLVWNTSPLADLAGYKVYAYNDTTGDGELTGLVTTDVGTDTTFRNENVISAQTAWAKVATYDNSGNESFLSNTVSALATKVWVDSLRLPDEQIDHVISHTPTIKFRSDCDTPYELIDYKMQVSSTTDFSSPDLWDLDWGNGGDIVEEDGYSQTVIYNGATPLNGETYYLRVKTRNNGPEGYAYTESDWSDTLAFRLNTEPESPLAPFAPADNAIVTSTPYLTAIATTDAQNDTLTYGFNVYSDEALSQEVRSVSGLSTPVWQVDPALPDEATYWWTARAWDGYEWSAPTAALSFVVNDDINSPAAFSLLTPDDVSTNITGIETLTWESTTDSDVGDTISYYVYLSKTSDFSSHVEVLFNAANTSLEVDDLVNGQTYYWKVKAQDTNSEGTWSTETWSFTVEIPGSPEAFALESPTNGAGLGSDTATLRWLASSDDDPGDAIHYEVQWAIEESFFVYDSASTTDTFYVLSDLEIVAEALLQRGGGFNREALDLSKKKQTGGISTQFGSKSVGNSEPETGYMIDALPDDTVIYWRVKAVDTQDHDTWAFPGIPGWSFTTGYAEAPAPFSLVGPADGSICTTGDTTLVWRNTTDNDPNDAIEYRVFIATDSGFSQDLETHVTSDTSLAVTNQEDNTTYFWKVKAIDDNSDGTWSNEIWSFSVNIPENPESFTLLEPSNLAYVPYDTVDVMWSETDDVDPGDVITYQLDWALDQNFVFYDSIQTSETWYSITNIDDIVFNPEGSISRGFNERTLRERNSGSALDAIPDDTPVWWRVRAIDQYGNVTWAQPGPGGFAFMVDMPDEPEAFSLVSPADGSTCLGGDTTLVWDSTTDPDLGDEILYVIYTASDEYFIFDVDSMFTPDTTITISDRAEGSTLYWKVRAKDTNSNGTWSTESWSLNFHLTGAPYPFDLVSPVDEYVSPSKDVELTWNSTTDPDPLDVVSYVLYLSTDSEFTSVDSIEVTTTTYTATNLLDDTTYWWKVRAKDITGKGTWSNQTISFSIDVSENPEAFALTSPSNGAIIAADTVQVNWSPSSDVDPGDNLTYEVQWSTDSGFGDYESTTTSDTFYVMTDLTTIGGDVFGGTSGFGNTNIGSSRSGSALDAIPDDTTIYWRVFVKDDNNNIRWAFPGESGWSFSVELDEMPLPFSLAGPADGSTCSTGDTTLVWHSTTDADPGDVIGYIVYMSTDSEFTSVDSIEVADTSYTATNLLDDTTYWWKVRAQDTNSPGTWSTETWSFDVAVPDAPELFALYSPPNYSTVGQDTVLLNWYPANDVDPGDVITYTVEWATNSSYIDMYSATTTSTTYELTDLDMTVGESTGGQTGFSDSEFGAGNGGSALDALPDDTFIFWRVKATDQYGNTSYAVPGVQGFAFMVWVPEEPGAFSLLSPEDGSTCLDGDTTLVWESAVEPDLSDELMYVLYTASDAEFTTNVDSSITTDTTFTIYDIPEGSTLYWKVRAQDENTTGTWSTESWSFDVYQPVAPEPFSLLTPADGGTSTDGDMTLTWESTTDADPGDVISYVLYLATDVDFTSVDSIEVADATYTLNNLLDDTTYWWKVRAQDQESTGTWSTETWSFDVNIPENPDAFVLHMPYNGAIIEDDTTTLRWYPATDVDPGDVITYHVEWSDDPEFASFETESTPDTFYVLTDLSTIVGTAFGGGLNGGMNLRTPSGSALDALPDDTTIYWRVRAEDQYGNNTYALPGEDGWSFMVELDEMPLPFSLVAPVDESTCSTGDTTLVWNSTTDADPGDVIGYILYLSTDVGFTTVDSIEVADTTYTLNNLIDDTQYWWKVRAQDTNSIGTWSTETWSFDVNIPDGPEAFTLMSPSNEAVFSVDNVTVKWSSSSDVDPGDEITYELEYSQFEDFNDLTSVTTSDTTADLTNLTDDKTYYWRVKAIDGDDNYRYAMQGLNGWSFSTNIPEVPEVFSLVSPGNGSVCVSGDTTLVWNSTTDPDPGDAISYVVYTAYDENYTIELDSLFTPDTSIVLSDLPAGSSLYWKVRAQDTNTSGTWSAESWYFDLYLTGSPDAFSLVMPDSGSVIPTDYTTLQWGESFDDDPSDFLSYILYLATNSEFTSIDSIEVTTTSYEVTNLLDDTTYWWKVRAQDTNSIGTWSNETWSFDVDISEGPESFTLLSPSNEAVFNVDNVTVKWSSSSDVDPGDEITYELEYALESDFSDLVSITTSDTTADLTELADDMTYYWRVKAVDGNENYRYAMQGSSGWSFSIDIPEVPDAFSLVGPLDGSVNTTGDTTLVWNTAIDPDPYEGIVYVVYLAQDAAFTAADSFALQDTTYTLHNLVDDTDYWWKVRAQDTNTTGTWSTEAWSFSVDIPNIPEPFSMLSPGDESIFGRDSVRVKWSSSSDADPGDVISYELHVSEVSDFSNFNTITLSDTLFDLTGLNDDQAYYWRVKAVDGDGNSRWAMPGNTGWSFDIAIPEVPNTFSLIGPDDGSANITGDTTLVWHSTSDPDPNDPLLHVVYLSQDATFTIVDSFVVQDTTYQLDHLLDDTTYWWKVRAIDSNTTGTWSTETWSFSVDIPNIPEPFGMLSPGDESIFGRDSVRVKWSSSSDADPGDVISYELHVSEVSDFSNFNTITLSDTLFDLTGLNDDQAYYWRVKAIDSDNNSRWAMPGNTGWSFDIAIPEVPNTFSLIGPVDSSINFTGDTILVWHQATDPDPYEGIVYVVYLGQDAAFTTADSFAMQDTTYTLHNLLDDTTYWWKVRAQDTNTTGTWSTETWSFDVNRPQVPEPFTMLAPVDGAVMIDDTVTVNWTSSSDLDPGDVLVYEIQWSSEPSFGNYLSEVTSDTFYVLTDLEEVEGDSRSGSTGSNRKVLDDGAILGGVGLDELPDDTHIYWRVKVRDSYNLERWSQQGSNGWSFEIDMAEPPLPFSLVSPDNDWTDETNAVSLSWDTTSDPDPGDQVGYVIYLSTDEDFTEVDSTEVTGNTLTLHNLQDDTTYWWKVRAQDTNTTGTWSSETWSFDVAIPEAPEPFVQLAPTNGALISETTVLANWTHSSDNDPGDLLTYEIQWASNPEFNDFGSATTADTFYTLDELADDQTMYWRVKVTDSYDLSTWSMAGTAGWSFEVDVPQPPLPFSLVAPDSAIVLDTLAATFEWEGTTDPDPGDVVSYILSLSLAEDFRDTLTVHYTAESATSFPVPYMPDDSDYWWRVTASDQNGDFTISDETWTFHTAWPEPPHPFELNDGGIDMNATGDSIVVTLTWHRTWDPDPESLEYYKVLIDTTDDMDIPIVLADSVTVLGTDSTVTWTKTYAPQDLPTLGETFWTVYAYDDNTDGTWADEPMVIFMTSVDETPWGNVPVEYEFAAAYPNPFNPTMTAVISLPHPSDLTVTVFNVMGQRVATIAEGHYQEGFHSFIFNGQNMASGVYFIIANSPGKLNQVKKVVLMK